MNALFLISVFFFDNYCYKHIKFIKAVKQHQIMTCLLLIILRTTSNKERLANYKNR